MATLKVERIGGLAGVGQPGSHVESQGEVDEAALSLLDRQTVAHLFEAPRKASDASDVRDGFRYRLTRLHGEDAHTVEVAEAALPKALIDSVKDELV